MKLPEKSKAVQLFEQFCDGYKRRDLPFLLKLFTQNCNLWGTGLDEYRVGLKELADQLERDWSQSEQGEIRVDSFVAAPPDALWAAAVCKAIVTIDGKEHVLNDLRGTIIIKKENGIEKIAHMHASFPDYRNEAQNSFPQTHSIA